MWAIALILGILLIAVGITIKAMDKRLQITLIAIGAANAIFGAVYLTATLILIGGIK